MNQHIKGVLYALIAASLWGISGTFVQFLSEQKNVEPAWLITFRMFSAGTILLLIAYFTKDKGVHLIWKDPINRKRLVFFGFTGMFSVQFFFFKAIGYSNAATATILQYIGPVLIVIYYSIISKRLPTIKEFIAIGLALIGTFLLVTHGNFNSLIISPSALLFGLLSAVGLMLYSIQPIPIMQKYSAIVVVGWSMLIGGCLAMCIHPIWEFNGIIDWLTIGSISFILLLGTVLPFSIFLMALKMIGAQKTSLISSFEPLSAAIVAIVWLGVQMMWIDWLGAICIMLTVFLLAKPNESTVKE